MTNGLPVITTNKCIAELIENGTNGFIIDADDIHVLIDKILIILENEILLINMSNNNLNKIKITL